MSWRTKFIEHPASVGETYTEHMAMAGVFAIRLFAGALACAVHAVLPFLFQSTGSAIITDLHDRMVVNRRRRGQPSPGEPMPTGNIRSAALGGGAGGDLAGR